MTIVNVLFVCPPYSPFSPGEAAIPPLGLSRIASKIRSQANIRIIDMGSKEILGENSWEALINIVEEFKPDLVAIGPLVTSNRAKGEEISRVVKSITPSCRVAIGGPDPTFTYEDILKSIQEVDIIFLGEAEQNFYEFLKILPNPKEWDKLNGVAFRYGSKIIVKASQKMNRSEFDNLPLPAWDLFPIEEYKTISMQSKQIPYLPLESSRGCPLDCIFCACTKLFKKTIKYRTAKSIGDEIELNIKKYGYNRFVFNDDNFAHNKKHVFNVCEEIIRRDLNKMQYACSSTIESKIFDDSTLIKLMKKAGFIEIFMGCETIHSDVIKIVGKTLKCGDWRDKIYRAIDICRTNGIASRTNWILGLPNDTRKKFLQTISFIKEVKPDSALLSLLQPYPGTRLNMLIEQNPSQIGVFKLTENPSKIIASKFDPVIYTKWMSKEDMIELGMSLK